MRRDQVYKLTRADHLRDFQKLGKCLRQSGLEDRQTRDGENHSKPAIAFSVCSESDSLLRTIREPKLETVIS